MATAGETRFMDMVFPDLAEGPFASERRLCTRGTFVLVAVDEGGKPVSLALDPTSPETAP